jgi:translation elongation factor aEF-1 beta
MWNWCGKFYKGSFLELIMAIVAVIAKVMPEGLNVDLEGLKGKAQKVLEDEGAKNVSFEIKEVAFGLKALMVKFAWPEEQEGEIYETKLGEIEGVSSVDTVDYRRAFG